MYEKITLPNGVRILYENIPYVRSVAAGIWVGTGSRYENAEMNGASHFIEHMVFKGTNTRSAADIAELMDEIGGQINAFTTKECTCFYGRVLDLHLPRLADILCDMFFNSKFDNEDTKNEFGVICEEIDMYEDSPDDLVVERLLSAVYNEPLAMPILGTKESISTFTGDSLKEYKRTHYSPDRIVITVSGSFRQSDIDYFKDRFSAMPILKADNFIPAVYSPVFISKAKDIEQNHLFLGFESNDITSDERYGMQLLSSILGGGMSSRLFQSVREKYGLCYSIYTFSSSYIDSGIFGIYTALGNDTEEQALKLIVDEIHRLLHDGVTEAELSRAREQMKANVLMSLESTASRMTQLGKNELYLNRVPDSKEVIAAYDSVTADTIAALSQKYLTTDKMSFSAVGKVKKGEEYFNFIHDII